LSTGILLVSSSDTLPFEINITYLQQRNVPSVRKSYGFFRSIWRPGSEDGSTSNSRVTWIERWWVTCLKKCCWHTQVLWVVGARPCQNGSFGKGTKGSCWLFPQNRAGVTLRVICMKGIGTTCKN